MVSKEIRLVTFFPANDGEALNSQQKQDQEMTVHLDITGLLRISIQSAKTRLGADCGSDHELLIVKFRLKLKKVGESP